MSDNWLTDVGFGPVITSVISDPNLCEFLEILDLSYNPGLSKITYSLISEIIEARHDIPLR